MRDVWWHQDDHIITILSSGVEQDEVQVGGWVLGDQVVVALSCHGNGNDHQDEGVMEILPATQGACSGKGRN
jgi:hypothetical protein